MVCYFKHGSCVTKLLSKLHDFPSFLRYYHFQYLNPHYDVNDLYHKDTPEHLHLWQITETYIIIKEIIYAYYCKTNQLPIAVVIMEYGEESNSV